MWGDHLKRRKKKHTDIKDVNLGVSEKTIIKSTSNPILSFNDEEDATTDNDAPVGHQTTPTPMDMG